MATTSAPGLLCRKDWIDLADEMQKAAGRIRAAFDFVLAKDCLLLSSFDRVGNQSKQSYAYEH